MTISEVAEAAGLDRWATRRILLTLETLGYAGREGKLFFLSSRILNLGYAYLVSLDIWNVANPLIEKIVDELRLSCSVAVLDGPDIVYIARVPSKRNLAIPLSVGSRIPAYCTAIGRVLFGSLSQQELEECLGASKLEKRTPYTITDKRQLEEKVKEARQQGWCMLDQEFEVGIRSIAVPIRDSLDRVKAAMSPSGLTSRFKMPESLVSLQKTAGEIEEIIKKYH